MTGHAFSALARSPLFLAICVLWLLGRSVNLGPPVTGGAIVTVLLFVLLLVWMIATLFGGSL